MIPFIFKSKMSTRKILAGINIPLLFPCLFILLTFNCTACNGDRPGQKKELVSTDISDSIRHSVAASEYNYVNSMLVLPKNPGPDEPFRILATGGDNIRNAHIIVKGPYGKILCVKSKTGQELPAWLIDDFTGTSAGKYNAILISDNQVISNLEFEISSGKIFRQTGEVWKTLRGWDSGTETVYSAWINALFYGFNEQASWSSLHEVTSNQNQNFLYNYLSQGEDDPGGKNSLIMQPDCADNPFFLRAYFAWKLGLPFGFHICDRGYPGHNPKTGQWITNESSSSKTNPALAFNAFLRRVADGVHSGTARTAMDDENSDYYPVLLERESLRPGVVFADPYGHTLILTGRVSQTGDTPGLLLAVDAQPDGTVGIKRFWKGNFLFNTSGVIGEPGFKAFRPVLSDKGVSHLIRNRELTSEAGYVPFSLQQKKMGSDVFYKTMERLINPKPLDPEIALLDLIQALHEQLLVRVTSVANGEAYFKLHPGTLIPMPSTAAGIFLAGGQWENFSTPNRDLRLLIAMDAVLGFPELVAHSPKDFNISGLMSPEQIGKKLQKILDQKASELSISYTRTDGSIQKLTVGEILQRIDAFEMAYNPNDGIEVRWGAPENSSEIATCKRYLPAKQLETMRSVRKWFGKRLHPPT